MGPGEPSGFHHRRDNDGLLRFRSASGERPGRENPEKLFHFLQGPFWQGHPPWLIELAGIAFFALDLWAAWNFFLANGGVAGIALLGFCACIALIFLSCLMYVYPLLAAFDFRLKKILRDSFIMAMGNLHVTITLFVMTALVCVLIYYVSGLVFFWIGL